MSDTSRDYLNTVALDDVPALPGMTAEKLRKIRLIQEIRQFTIDRLGFRETESYLRYQPRGSESVIGYKLTISRRERLERPTCGRHLPLFREKRDAVREADRFDRAGFDVHVTEVGGYSSSGELAEPILPVMLEYEDALLVSTIIHELGHATVYSPSLQFSESFAEFVQDCGSELFWREREDCEEELYRQRDVNFDERLFGEFVRRSVRMAERSYGRCPKNLKRVRVGLFRRIADLYRSYQSQSNRCGHKFDHGDADPHFNNASLLLFRDYSEPEPFERLFRRLDGDWPEFIRRCQAAAAESDPFAALKGLTPRGTIALLKKQEDIDE